MSTTSSALILFAHGARDARWSRTLGLLRDQIVQRDPQRQVELAFLEFQSPSLEQALQSALAAGAQRIDIAPVFWASGGHVANDVPPLLDAFRQQHPAVPLHLLPVLSELPGMLEFIATQLLAASASAVTDLS